MKLQKEGIAVCVLLLSLFFTACNSRNDSIAHNQNADDLSQISRAFSQWKSNQFHRGGFITKEDCNVHLDKGKAYNRDINFIIPDEVSIHLAFINEDDKIDALICFDPQPCTQFEASWVKQRRVLILSDSLDYTVNDSLIENIERKYPNQWFEMNGAHRSFLQGTAFECKDSLNRNCIERQFHIHFESKEVFFLNE